MSVGPKHVALEKCYGRVRAREKVIDKYRKVILENRVIIKELRAALEKVTLSSAKK